LSHEILRHSLDLKFLSFIFGVISYAFKFLYSYFWIFASQRKQYVSWSELLDFPQLQLSTIILLWGWSNNVFCLTTLAAGYFDSAGFCSSVIRILILYRALIYLFFVKTLQNILPLISFLRINPRSTQKVN
jgi:hypothetical protein